ncbi:hypothetical protein Acor_74720 [Acrocarpospora corrugata]|uniref:Uncharacterized protein n=1 Tax=Acrocarpospora corrugata TaxID=35763 RepID=A0A5M3W957_9ACTN|nr:hypothetical protein Acor_74720 [Acrocarpospora corrugata]
MHWSFRAGQQGFADHLPLCRWVVTLFSGYVWKRFVLATGGPRVLTLTGDRDRRLPNRAIRLSTCWIGGIGCAGLRLVSHTRKGAFRVPNRTLRSERTAELFTAAGPRR